MQPQVCHPGVAAAVVLGSTRVVSADARPMQQRSVPCATRQTPVFQLNARSSGLQRSLGIQISGVDAPATSKNFFDLGNLAVAGNLEDRDQLTKERPYLRYLE
jgi:hypothetical protein